MRLMILYPRQKKHLDTILDQRALDMPQFKGCLKEDRRSASKTLSEGFDINLTMMHETVLTFCEPTRLPHNLDNVNYCIEQCHKQTQRKSRQDLPLNIMEETLPEIQPAVSQRAVALIVIEEIYQE